jgi:hypothetical protein
MMRQSRPSIPFLALILALVTTMAAMPGSVFAQQPPPPPPPGGAADSPRDDTAEDDTAEDEGIDEGDVEVPSETASTEAREDGDTSEDGAAPPPPSPDRQEAPDGPPSPDPIEDPAWREFRRAFELYAEGDRSRSREMLSSLVREYPGHPAARSARSVLQAMDSPEGRVRDGQPEDEKRRRVGEEFTSGLARAELAFFQTINGLTLGAEVCAAARCDDSRVIVGSMLLGGTAGLALSLGLTTDGITPGHTLSINSGSGWGAWNGIALSVILEPQSEQVPLLIGLSQLAGTGVGALFHHFLQPTSGDVSLANSGGIWSGLLTLFTIAGLQPNVDESVVFSALLGASNLGLAGGAILSKFYPMSRGRTFIIDSGGLLGMLLGMGTAVIVTDDADEPLFFFAAAGGSAAGLALATFLSRDWDEEEQDNGPNVSLGFTPTPGGAAVHIGGRF